VTRSAGVYTSHIGNNADLILDVCSLYLNPGDKVADVTYGRGVFWRNVDLRTIDFHPSDKLTCKSTPYDFCHLPYEDQSFDIVVFDPPYVHNPGAMMVDARYRNAETTRGMYHDDIIELYRLGMTEARRILKVGGLLWVKCKDEVESSVQRWSHIEIALMAWRLNLYALDLFVLTQNSKPVIQHNQKHARKNHSFLWIFRVVASSDDKISEQTALSRRNDFGVAVADRNSLRAERGSS